MILFSVKLQHLFVFKRKRCKFVALNLQVMKDFKIFLYVWLAIDVLVYLYLWLDIIYYKYNFARLFRRVVDAFTEED